MKLSLLAMLSSALFWTGQAEAEERPRPSLIVAISVDQFSADLFAEYRQTYSKGMKRMAEGAVFPSGYQSHAATETCPGHSTILTGSHPARTGIIANYWFDPSSPRASKLIYCAENPEAAGNGAQDYVVAPTLLKVPTLGDRMKAANSASRVVAVAGKDRAAIMMGGHRTDQIWFWDGKRYVTLKGRTDDIPKSVGRINARADRAIANPLRQDLPAQCRAYAKDVVLPGGKKVGQLPSRKAGDTIAFRASVDFDRATTDLAIGLLEDLRLGIGPATDLLTIGLSATDYVGHFFGTEGAEMCAQMAGLDANIARILSALDRRCPSSEHLAQLAA